MPETLVLDASLLVDLVEDRVPDATALQTRIAEADELHAPIILLFESISVCRRRHMRELDLARSLAADIEALPITLWPWDLLRDRIWHHAANITTNDAAYVAVAEATDSTLLTRDRRLARAPGLRCRVEML